MGDTLFISVLVLSALLLVVPTIWKVLIIAVIVVLITSYLLWYSNNLKKMRLLGFDEIDKMTGVEFEKRLWLLFKDLGYQVQTTPASGDWGADLIISKDGYRTVVQAKRYSKPVGVTAVQEAVTAKAKYNCAKSLVVTNNVFTPQASALAFANGTELWDRNTLIKRLKSLNK